MANPQKPAGRRQRTNHPNVVDIRAFREVDPPDPPAGLSKATRDWWRFFWSTDLARAALGETDLPALERLASLYDLRAQSLERVREHPTVDGSRGQQVLNPLMRQMVSWDAEIRQLEDRFGLTPKARKALELSFGAAKKQLDDLRRPFTNDPDDGGEAPVVVEIE